MPKKSETIKRPVLLPLGVTLVLLLLASLACLTGIQRLAAIRQTSADVANVQHLFAGMLEERQILISSLIDRYTPNQELQDAFLARDRQRLLQAAMPLFKKIRSKYEITHFYFVDPDRVCFLRVHNPGRHGDTINRFTMLRAARDSAPAGGIELGPFGTFTLRVVHPWQVAGKLIGYIELGTEIEYLTPLIKHSLNVDLLVAIDKRYLNRIGWQEGIKMMGRTGDWNLFPYHAIVDQTLPEIPPGLSRHLTDAHQGLEVNDAFRLFLRNRTFRSGMSDLLDTGGRKVGKIIVLADCTAEEHFFLRLFWLLLVVGGGGGALLFYIFSRHIDRLGETLHSQHEALRQKILAHSQAEESLRESNESLNALIHASPLAILTLTGTGAIESWNLSAEQIFQWTAGEVIGRQPPFIIGESQEVFNRLLLSTFLGDTATAKDISGLRKNGAPLDLTLSTAPLRDREGKIGKALFIFQDVTARKKIEQNLREAQKMKAIGTLAGGIAHDFNNILTTILGYAEISRRAVGEQQPIRKNLDEIVSAGKRAASLVSQLLTFSRRKEQQRRPVLVQDVINEVLGLLRGTIPSTIEIRQEMDSDCGPIEADPTQIHQVVMNLCINGYQAMRERGGILTVGLKEVQISATTAKERNIPAGACACLTVADQGVGMDEGTLERIFEPYFSTKEHGQGTGLGLSLVHGIIESHHGTVKVQSVPGHGTLFTLYLPLLGRMEAAPVANQETAALPLPRLRYNIVFVDDEPAIVALCKSTLQELGCAVMEFTDGREALEAIRNDPDWVDLLITDQVMPRLTGIELARATLLLLPDLPTIMITGYSDTVDARQAEGAGIAAFVMKPITQAELAAVIAKTMRDRAVAPRQMV